MQLSRTERWILANQYRLLETLDPERADRHREVRLALERGDKTAIRAAGAFIMADLTTLTDHDRSFVEDILLLYETLQESHAKLDPAPSVEPDQLEFAGFDSAEETEFDEYATVLIGDESRFTALRAAQGSISGARIPAYRRMLEAWKLYGNPRDLSTVQILYILEAANEPTHD